MIENYLASEKLIKRLKVCHARYRVKCDFDDFYQDYAVHLLSGKGKKQTLDQFTIDWIRSKYGRKGQKLNIENTSEFNPDIHLTYDNKADRNLLEDFYKTLSPSNKAFAILAWRYGLNNTELSNVFSISGACVSAIIDRILKELIIFKGHSE